MPLFLQALPLTIHTFWRYLLLLPILAVAAFFFSLLQIIPLLGALVPGTVGAALLILGMRCALRARGHGNELDRTQLLLFSVFFGLVLLVEGAPWFVFGKILQATGFDEAGFRHVLVQQGGWQLLLLTTIGIKAIFAAIFAVPITMAAHTATPRGGRAKPLFGIASGFASLILVSGVWLYCGHFFAIFGEVWSAFGLLVFALLDITQGREPSFAFSLGPWSLLRATLLMTLASSWYFATAVLAWEREMARVRAVQTESAEAGKFSEKDFRKLREQRKRSGEGTPT